MINGHQLIKALQAMTPEQLDQTVELVVGRSCRPATEVFVGGVNSPVIKAGTRKENSIYSS